MYTFHSRVRYSEINKKKELDLFSVVNYFQDCSTFQSEALGIGMQFLEERNHVWLMHAWQVIVNRYPSICEEIAVSTWAYDFKAMYGYRNFLMQDKAGETLAYANSIWVLADIHSGRPVRITEEDSGRYPLEAPYEMTYAPRKITLPQEMQEEPAFLVVRSDIDTNGHVNNGQYIRMAETYLPDDFTIRQMRAEYRTPAVLGDRILPRTAYGNSPDTGDLCHTVALCRADGQPYAIVSFSGDTLK